MVSAVPTAQRGELLLAVTVVVGLLSGDSVQLTVWPDVKSTPNDWACVPGLNRVGRKPAVSRASAFLVPYGIEIPTPLSLR